MRVGLGVGIDLGEDVVSEDAEVALATGGGIEEFAGGETQHATFRRRIGVAEDGGGSDGEWGADVDVAFCISLDVTADEFEDVANVIGSGGVIANEGNLGDLGGVGQRVFKYAIGTGGDAVVAGGKEAVIGVGVGRIGKREGGDDVLDVEM